MLLNSCATSINNVQDSNISINDLLINEQALSEDQLFYEKSSKKEKLKKRELILESLKYGPLEQNKLNDLINLSQSNDLKIYGRELIEDLIENKKILAKRDSSNISINIEEKYKSILLHAAINLEHLKINLSFSENQDAIIINSKILKEELPQFCKSFESDQLFSVEKAIFKSGLSEIDTLVVYEEDFSKKEKELLKSKDNIRTILFKNEGYEKFASDSLGITENFLRHKKIDGLLPKTSINNTPRVRQDIKNIYFLMNYKNAKGLVPAFRYNYSLDINTYASINLIESVIDINKILDFESLIMPIPNHFGDSIFKTQFSNQSSIKDRLIYDNLHDLLLVLALKDQGINNAVINGRSGILYIKKNQCISRELPLKRINADEEFMLP